MRNDETVWKKIMELGEKETRTCEGGIANSLDKDEVHTILATMEFFGATEDFMALTMWDLRTARYRVFDWLAMCVDGRRAYKENDDAIKVIAHAYLKTKGNIDDFIADLRETDYDIDHDWESIILGDVK